MLHIIFYFLILYSEVKGERKHDYRYETLKNFSPGHICNYEAYHVNELTFVLYTCVLSSQCNHEGKELPIRRPELHFDNCALTFHKPKEGGVYVCCHPEDYTGTNSTAVNPTEAPLKFMPGFRSAFKCAEYSKLACLDSQFCPDSRRRERKGGRETDIGKYPHLALIGWHAHISHSQHWFCLGSIITERYVLTAATCREDENQHFASSVRVGVDVFCLVEIDCKPSQFAQEISIESHINHPANLLAWYYHDIMILKLSEDIKFNKKVRPACLYYQMDTTQFGGMFATYEERIVDGKSENTTHEMEIQILSTEACNFEWYSKDLRLVDPTIDPAIMFCAGLPHVEIVPCLYDYGGGLVIQEEDYYCIWQVYGVMAWSQTFFCKGHKAPIFTRISSYLSWIEGVIWSRFDIAKEYNRDPINCKDRLAPYTGDEGRCRA